MFFILANLSPHQVNASIWSNHYHEYDFWTRNSCSSRSKALLFWKIAEWFGFTKEPVATDSHLERAIHLVLAMSSSQSGIFHSRRRLLRWKRKPISSDIHELSNKLHKKTNANEFKKISLILKSYKHSIVLLVRYFEPDDKMMCIDEGWYNRFIC